MRRIMLASVSSQKTVCFHEDICQIQRPLIFPVILYVLCLFSFWIWQFLHLPTQKAVGNTLKRIEATIEINKNDF